MSRSRFFRWLDEWERHGNAAKVRTHSLVCQTNLHRWGWCEGGCGCECHD